MGIRRILIVVAMVWVIVILLNIDPNQPLIVRVAFFVVVFALGIANNRIFND